MSPGDDHETYGGSGHTRTRYPDDVYGTPRPRRSSSRSLVTVMGVVVVLIAAIAFANRGSDDSADRDGKTTAARPQPASTAATGTTPVPSGWSHDEQGAQSAAANYAVALGSADVLKADRRAEILRQVVVPEKRSELSARFDRIYTKQFLSTLGLDENGEPADGQTYVSRTVPIGTTLTAYSSTAATAEVWCTGLYGTAGEKSTDPVTTDWFTMTISLRWSGGDWKVDGLSQKDGPTPLPGDNKASTAEDMAQAVEEYGGFTYAR